MTIGSIRSRQTQTALLEAVYLHRTIPRQNVKGERYVRLCANTKPSETKAKITRRLTVSTKVKRLVAVAGATIIFEKFESGQGQSGLHPKSETRD
jgi:hypothetical protein